jgi:hypothetical protein
MLLLLLLLLLLSATVLPAVTAAAAQANVAVAVPSQRGLTVIAMLHQHAPPPQSELLHVSSDILSRPLLPIDTDAVLDSRPKSVPFSRRTLEPSSSSRQFPHRKTRPPRNPFLCPVPPPQTSTSTERGLSLIRVGAPLLPPSSSESPPSFSRGMLNEGVRTSCPPPPQTERASRQELLGLARGYGTTTQAAGERPNDPRRPRERGERR